MEMEIKVLGAGCANCHALADRAEEALRQLGIDGDVQAVTDYGEIAGYGVMNTPALVVGGRVVVAGRVPELPEIITLLTVDLD
jgi:small redox-active disulfide protein 2